MADAATATLLRGETHHCPVHGVVASPELSASSSSSSSVPSTPPTLVHSSPRPSSALDSIDDHDDHHHYRHSHRIPSAPLVDSTTTIPGQIGNTGSIYRKSSLKGSRYRSNTTNIRHPEEGHTRKVSFCGNVTVMSSSETLAPPPPPRLTFKVQASQQYPPPPVVMPNSTSVHTSTPSPYVTRRRTLSGTLTSSLLRPCLVDPTLFTGKSNSSSHVRSLASSSSASSSTTPSGSLSLSSSPGHGRLGFGSSSGSSVGHARSGVIVSSPRTGTGTGTKRIDLSPTLLTLDDPVLMPWSTLHLADPGDLTWPHTTTPSSSTMTKALSNVEDDLTYRPLHATSSPLTTTTTTPTAPTTTTRTRRLSLGNPYVEVGDGGGGARAEGGRTRTLTTPTPISSRLSSASAKLNVENVKESRRKVSEDADYTTSPPTSSPSPLFSTYIPLEPTPTPTTTIATSAAAAVVVRSVGSRQASINDLTDFFTLLDPFGSFDTRMATLLVRHGIMSRSMLLDMQPEDLDLFLEKLALWTRTLPTETTKNKTDKEEEEEEGVEVGGADLTAYQWVMLPRRLAIWKQQHLTSV